MPGYDQLLDLSDQLTSFQQARKAFSQALCRPRTVEGYSPGAGFYAFEEALERARAERSSSPLIEMIRETLAKCRDTIQGRAFDEIRSARIAYEDAKWTLARDAGVPEDQLGNLIIKVTRIGVVNIFFGGEGGDPYGAGHGHYVIWHDGKMTYKREPGAKRGIQNYATLSIA